MNKALHEKDWWPKIWETYWQLAAWVGILLVSAITFLTGGLFASCISRTTSRATALAYGFTAVICIATLAPLVLEDNLAPWLSYFILSLNPIAAAMQVTSGAFDNYPGLWVCNIFVLASLTILLLAASVARVWRLFNSQA